VQNNTYSLKQIIFAWVLVFTISFFAFIYILLSNLFDKYVDQSSFKDLRHAKLIIEKIIQSSEISLKSDVARHLSSGSFLDAVAIKDIAVVNRYIQNWKAISGILDVSIYNTEGLKLSLTDLNPISDNAKISLKVESRLKRGYGISRYSLKSGRFYIEVLRKIVDQSGLPLGYIEESKTIDLQDLKESIPNDTDLLIISSNESLILNNSIEQKYIKNLSVIKTEAFEIEINQTQYDGLMYTIDSENKFLIIKEKLKNSFYSVFYKNYLIYFIVYIIFISLFFYLSGQKMIIKPLENLSLFIKTNEKEKSETLVSEIRKIEDLVYDRVSDYNNAINETHSVREKEVNMMVASLAHELNNALSYVGGNVSFLKEETSQDKPDQQEIKDSLEDIEKGFDRMKNIVSDLKVFSSKSDFEIKENSLDETFQSLEKEFPSLQIKNEVSEDKVLMDSERLMQVLENVVQNALHSYKNDKESAFVKINAYKITDDEFIYIDVLDQGSGIPSENKSKIFQPFFTTKKNKGGTGLGLALSQNIMRGMGGDLILKDTSSKGSIFCLKVKRAQKA
jgi:signal transduction histidine kinase